jgi:hypothetical protein
MMIYAFLLRFLPLDDKRELQYLAVVLKVDCCYQHPMLTEELEDYPT